MRHVIPTYPTSHITINILTITTNTTTTTMATFTPYAYFQCPCSESSPITRHHHHNDRHYRRHRHTRNASVTSIVSADDDDDDDKTFDPRATRSNFSLYPLEYLLYCEDCAQIRCPRCVSEEIVAYFCPNCLFEVPSGNLKSDGNRYPSTVLLMISDCNLEVKLTVYHV